MEDGQNADLVILAPSMAECRTIGWLEEAVRLLARRLEPHGVGYVLAPPTWRLQLKHLLRCHNLPIEQAIIHLPDYAASRYLVPLSSAPARYAFSKVLLMPPWAHYLASLGMRFPGCEKLLEHVWPSVALIARRPGARPLMHWLFQLDGEGDRIGSAVIRTSWRGADGSVLVHRFLDCEAQPSAVAKLNLTAAMASNRVGEAETLNRLGASARSAGAEVPRPLLLGQLHGHPVLLQSVVHGRPIASLLASRPSRLLDLIESLVAWLERWNRSTMTIGPIDADILAREILAPAALLAPLLQQGRQYREWLIRRYAAVGGISAVFVATHNDLTMWNVLLDERGGIGVLDWEAARAQGLPLVDFFYAVTDAVAAVQGYVDRPKAFESCFAPDGVYAYAVTQILSRLRYRLEISDEAAELCFHACWLHHAANELRSGEAHAQRQFLKIVQWLALHRQQLSGWWHS